MNWRGIPLCLVVVFAVGGSGGAAQAPAVNETYVVAYVDVLPSQRGAMRAALQRYRDASRQEKGSLRIDTLEQRGRPGHFVVVERWVDQAALDAHRLADHTTGFLEALQPIRVSGYDERPYTSLSTAPRSVAGSSETVYVVSHVDIGSAAGREIAPGLLRGLAEESGREPGSLGFHVLQHAMRANHFTVFEVWRDQSALDAHVAAAHTRAYRDTVQPISGSPVDERVYTAVE
jgi:quinol monooxygenase YgiN